MIIRIKFKVYFLAAITLLILSVGCSTRGLHVVNEKSNVTWYRDENIIELNILINNGTSKDAKFYVYINQKDNDIANYLNFGLLPVEKGRLFNLSRNEEKEVSLSFDIPEDASLNKQKLSEGYEVIIGHLEAPNKEKQRTFKIKEVNIQ
ncbi:hypothetical protein [Peribacillus alkalitolerans]|uniref:hypothetical protein n=1 Tax=Peribacillus alkalitolerans TaxID=1550385 RepID=UPI0013CFDFFB|nr:hypothetical protein [Peribacillus alkalitolerans]